MQRQFDVVTFDCYGTLIDWEAGLVEAFAEVAVAKGIRVELDRVVRLHAEIEPEIQRGPYRRYREVLEETARRMAPALGFTLDAGDAAFLPQSLASWPPFPDTVRALERLARSGYRLGILSNVDRDLLAGTLTRLAVPFDLIVTAEDVRAYKPATAHFLAARERIGEARWLHAAQSRFHDIAPARALGIPVAWINRQREPAIEGAGAHADRTFADLQGLAEWLC